MAGDAAGARDQFAALLPIRERVQGAEHPDTLTDRDNLAYWARVAGKRAPTADPETTRECPPKFGHCGMSRAYMIRFMQEDDQ
uniref:hypothetical protein n=1 Tax=Herbidospora sakaeratensis TaxID=564415 RepID=UPI0007816D6D|nr:hypothetical protein [Herbidospora sakaeratensis]